LAIASSATASVAGILGILYLWRIAPGSSADTMVIMMLGFASLSGLTAVASGRAIAAVSCRVDILAERSTQHPRLG
jgi:hypothetical protein